MCINKTNTCIFNKTFVFSGTIGHIKIGRYVEKQEAMVRVSINRTKIPTMRNQIHKPHRKKQDKALNCDDSTDLSDLTETMLLTQEEAWSKRNGDKIKSHRFSDPKGVANIL